MKREFWIALMLVGCLGLAPRVSAQSDTGQTKAAKKNKKDAQQASPQSPAQAPANQAAPASSNPFPTDTSDVPVMPSTSTDAPASTFSDADGAAASLPSDDADPVRSPDGAAAGDGGAAAQDFSSISSSRSSNLDSLLPTPGDDADQGKRKKKGAALDEPPKETAKEDVSVGKYYLDQKNWKAAESRFQSALVLSPEDPEVYWGLAESARHLGKFAEARANYQKVMEYDPGSKHAKEAQKALKDPEIESAKAVATPQ